MLNFATSWLLILLPLPIIIWRVSRMIKNVSVQETSAAFLYPQAELLAQLSNENTAKTIPWQWMSGCMLLIIALAQPQWIGRDTLLRPGHNIMLAIDLSGSMRAQDYMINPQSGNPQSISRLDMVRQLLPEFIAQRRGDRIGLIAFADDAMTFSPLTTDHTLLLTLFNELQHGMTGERTALGDAITLAVQRLNRTASDNKGKSEGETDRVLILFSDGANTSGSVSPEHAIEYARRHQVRIHTIGIGSNNDVAFPRGPVISPLTVKLPMNHSLLNKIALETGGIYYHATPQSDFSTLLKHLNKTETPHDISERAINPDQWFWLPLLFGLLLLGIDKWQHENRVTPCQTF